MRGIFGIVGLLVVVLVVGMLAKKQLGAGVAPPEGGGTEATAATPKQQVQRFEQAVQGTMQQARPMPDDDK